MRLRWLGLWLVVLAGMTGCDGGLLKARPTPTPTIATSPTPLPTPTPLHVAGMPEDVPLPPGAYDVQVQRAGYLVIFRVKAPLGKVLAFYQQMLPRYGWQGDPVDDRVVGYVATLVRAKPAGERLMLNLHYDVRGGFVVVAVSVARP